MRLSLVPDAEMVYWKYYYKVYNYIYGQLRQHEAAEDVRRMCLLLCWKNPVSSGDRMVRYCLHGYFLLRGICHRLPAAGVL